MSMDCGVNDYETFKVITIRVVISSIGVCISSKF
jgi:hypothetical protein